MSDTTCPKCSGPREAKALYCPFCGVVFSRFEGGGAAAAPAPAPRPAAAYAEPVEGFQAAPVNPYQAPSASVAPRYRPAPQPSQQATLAGRWLRLGAQLVDGLVFGVAVVVAAFVVGTSRGADESAAYVAIGIAALPIMFVNLYLLGSRGQTIGKMLVKVKIVRTTGEDANLLRLVLLRILPINAMGFIPLLGGLIGLIDALMIFGEERRCLHDLFADTIVVNA